MSMRIAPFRLPEPARALGFRGAARAWLGDAGGLQDMRRARRNAYFGISKNIQPRQMSSAQARRS